MIESVGDTVNIIRLGVPSKGHSKATIRTLPINRQDRWLKCSVVFGIGTRNR
ncbi:hypothetical protein [Acinetobacter phage P1068]|uniref:Uncharacterized protein n=1 Tax=Acinetobacter phage P919 TaxID=3229763 RepID=A0AB39AIV3_9CAUD|nr:hypothetical protein [Acinetobacter phage P1068]